MEQGSIDHKRLALFILVLMVGVFLVIFFISLIVRPKNVKNNDGEYVDRNSGAFMSYKDYPFLPLASGAANDLLRQDLAFFARNTIPKYGPNDDPSVNFKLSKDIKTNGASVSFSGVFERSKDNISVEVTQLNNNRIKTSITNTKSRSNIDDKLPSNSKRNQFIAKLPISNSEYIIDYDDDVDGFLITLYAESSLDKASSTITDALGIDSIKNENVKILGGTANSSPYW